MIAASEGTGMAGGLFYNLGRKMGPRVRKARWVWESMAGTEADALRLEHAVGADLAQEVRQQLAADGDDQLRRSLVEIGHRLAERVSEKRRSFHFEAFLAAEPNAFVLPGGYVFISRPIVELCRWNHDEMAFILAHEMSHVMKGHAIDRIVTNSAVSVASRAAPLRGALGSWLQRVGIQVLEKAYSRDQELEADRLGVRLARAAGYDPRASMRLLQRLAMLKTAPTPLDLGVYFSTHPTFDLRIQSIHRFLKSR